MNSDDIESVLQDLVGKLRDALEPVAKTIGDDGIRREILLALGLNPGAAGTAVAIPPAALASIDEYRTRNAENADLQAFISTLADITIVVQAVTDFIRSIAAAPDAEGQPGFAVEEAISFFLDSVIISYLRVRNPGVYITANALRLIEEQGIRYGGITKLLFRIGEFFEELWGSAADLRTEEDAQRVSDIALLITGVLAAAFTEAEFVYGFDAGPGGSPLADAASNRTLTLKISGKAKDSSNNDVKGAIDLGIVLVPAEHGGPGIATRIQASGSIDVPLTDNVSLSVTAPVPDLFVYIPTGERLPGMSAPVLPTSTDASFGVSLAYKSKPNKEIIWGDADGIHVRIGSMKLDGGLGLKDQQFKFEIKDSAFVLATKETDGFLSTMLNAVTSDGKLETKFDFNFGYRKREWFVGGGMGLMMTLPLHETLFIVKFDTLTIGLAIGETAGKKPGIKLEASVSFSLDIAGVLQASVDRVGLAGLLTFEDGDFSLQFKPPNGVGLAINAGPVRGGGFLMFDFDRQEYAGGLELDISGIVTVTALGMITTKLPDGSEGFSLIAIVSVEFGTPIQLGLGFTFNGVGGILGLNRTMRLEAMAAGIKTGAAERILFPRDIVANAARIISDLRVYFPPERDTFLIGGMLKIGWGTPSILTLSLGVIVQIPPGTFAILGVLKIVLPTEEAAILQLKVGFLGAYEPDKSRAWFYATLYDSRLLFMTLEGGLGVLVAWGDDSNLVVSAGGFHPQFRPPPLPFPTPDRISVNILNLPFARIRAMTYFAVTSNTVQFGARAELFFGFDFASLEGHLALDALFQFSPFYFIVEVSASVALKVFGAGLFTVRLRGSLEGTTPWRLSGAASVSILFFSVDVNIDETWGETVSTVEPGTMGMPLLVSELHKESNWLALPPRGTDLRVSLRKLDDATEKLVLHPIGELIVSQRALPLNVSIDKVGAQELTDAKRFRIDASTGTLRRRGDRDERFAMAQFRDMKDSEKLSLPAFQNVPGGITLGVSGDQTRSSRVTKRRVRYETIIVDTDYKRFVRSFFSFWDKLFTHFLGGSAVTKVTVSEAHRKQVQPFDERIIVADTGYAVANIANNRIVEGSLVFASEAQAREFMREKVAANPAQAAALHVIPRYEVNGVS